jgi:hypothetical protein
MIEILIRNLGGEIHREQVSHGDDMRGKNVFGAFGLHPPPCEWCDALRRRVLSRGGKA